MPICCGDGDEAAPPLLLSRATIATVAAVVVVVFIIVVVVVVASHHHNILLCNLLLDKRVDNVVLKTIHDERENHHDKRNLQLLVALGPAEGPVADLGDPRHEDEDDEDANLHAKEAAKVNDGLLQPPPGARRGAVVAGLDRVEGLAEGREGDNGRDDAEEDDEDGDADCCLVVAVVSLVDSRLSYRQGQGRRRTSMARFSR